MCSPDVLGLGEWSANRKRGASHRARDTFYHSSNGAALIGLVGSRLLEKDLPIAWMQKTFSAMTSREI